MKTIYCENQNKKRKINLSRIVKVAEIILKEIGKKRHEVTMIFVSNQKIRAINRKYLKKDRSTDVIAFEYNKEQKMPGMGKDFLGDIVISTDKAFQNSIKFGTEFIDEISLYVIHGILHLTGYDDKTREEKEKMRRKEDALLQKIKKTI